MNDLYICSSIKCQKMIVNLIILISILAGYILYKYNHSRNQKIILQSKLFKSSLYSSIAVVMGIIIIELLAPNKPISLDNFKLYLNIGTGHSDNALQLALLEPLNVLANLNLIDLSSSVIVATFWALFINKLLNLKIKWTKQLIFILGGCLMPFLAVPISVLARTTLPTEFSQSGIGYFFYWVTQYAVISELIILLPTALFILSKKKLEGIEALLYLSLTAIGYSFTETLYRPASEIGLLGSWTLLFSFYHVALSNIAIYGLLVYKLDPNRRNWGYTVLYFLLSALFSGIINFLYSEGYGVILPFLFVPFLLGWTIILNNIYSNSPKATSAHNSSKDLTMSIAVIFATILFTFSYLVNRITVQSAHTYELGMIGITVIGFVMGFIIFALNDIDIFPGSWRQLKFNSESPDEGSSILSEFIDMNVIVPQHLIGQIIQLHCPGGNTHLAEFFDYDKGKVVKRFILKKEHTTEYNWYFVKLKNKMNVIDEFHADCIAIKLNNPFASIVHDTHIKCHLRLIKSETDLKAKRISSANFFPYGNIMINGSDYRYE